MTDKFNIQKPLFFSAMLLISTTAFAQPPVVVKTYGQHVGEHIVYHYQVTNYTTDQKAGRVAIGFNYNYDNPNTPWNDEAELTVHPVGSYWIDGPTTGDQVGVSVLKGGTYTAPQGWIGYPQVHEETSSISFEFETTDPNSVIVPGQTMNFSITVPKMDRAYLAGHFTAGHRGGPGQMQPLDTTSPTLTLAISPTRLRARAGTLVTVNATLKVQDNYDTAPEIRLESITANEPLGASDVSGAVIGADDRQFQLRDVKVPRGSAGRIYTITYSATDASGNKAIATATVGVK